MYCYSPPSCYGVAKKPCQTRGGINSPEESAIIDDTPYPIEIMRQAVGEVMGKTRSGAPEITPTHRYIEFIPATFEEYYRLLGSEEIDCAPGAAFDPVEIPEGNDHFTAVREEGEGPEKLYALIESNVALPDGITFNVLGEYYTPYAVGIEPEVSQRVAARAAVLAGVVTTDVTEPTFTPHGTIKMYDDLLMLGRPRTAVPLANLEIMIQETRYIGGIPLYFLEYIRTDENGYFTSKKSYTRGQLQNLSFSLLWKQGTVSITDASGNLGQTWGKCDTYGAWNFTIDPSSIGQSRMTFYYAVLFRAVNVAFTGGTNVLQTYGNYIQLRAYDEIGDSSFAPDAKTGFYPFAKILCNGKNNSFDIISSAYYELGRICLYVYNHTTYLSQRNKAIKQSWGTFIRYFFMEKEASRIGKNIHEMIYYNGKMVQKPDNYNMQNWMCEKTELVHNEVIYGGVPTSMDTPIFIDIYDDFNQNQFLQDTGITDQIRLEGTPNDNICIPDFSIIYQIALRSSGVKDVGTILRTPEYMRIYGYGATNAAYFMRGSCYGSYSWIEGEIGTTWN